MNSLKYEMRALLNLNIDLTWSNIVIWSLHRISHWVLLLFSIHTQHRHQLCTREFNIWYSANIHMHYCIIIHIHLLMYYYQIKSCRFNVHAFTIQWRRSNAILILTKVYIDRYYVTNHVHWHSSSSISGLNIMHSPFTVIICFSFSVFHNSSANFINIRK